MLTITGQYFFHKMRRQHLYLPFIFRQDLVLYLWNSWGENVSSFLGNFWRSSSLAVVIKPLTRRHYFHEFQERQRITEEIKSIKLTMPYSFSFKCDRFSVRCSSSFQNSKCAFAFDLRCSFRHCFYRLWIWRHHCQNVSIDWTE